jgi:hypothetical protein
MRPSSTDPSRPRARLHAALWSLSLACVTLTPLAAAQTAPEARATPDAKLGVEDLIQRGIALRRSGDDAAALETFHQAEKKSPGSVRIMLHIATAAQAAGRWLEASTYLREVARHQDDPYYRQYKDEIAQIQKLVASRVGNFLAVGAPAGAEVRLNGNVIGTLPMTEPEPIQSGTYQLEVSLPGYYNERRTINVSGGVLAREDFALNPLPQTSNTSAAGVSLAASELQREWYERPWVTWALAGTSAALLTTSAVAFALRESHAARWNDDSECTPVGGGTRAQNCRAERTAVSRAETVGVVTAVAGLSFAGAALAQRFVLVEGVEHAPAEQQSAAITQCGVGWLSLSCKGQF